MPTATGTALNEVLASQDLLRETSLCELLTYYNGGAGVYRVTRLLGTQEPQTDGSMRLYSYVELQRIEAWSANAPSNAVVRLGGNPTTEVALRQDEEVGLLMYPPTADNRDCYGLFSLTVFHDVGGRGYTNGQLFRLNPVPASTLGAMVSAAWEKAGQPDCPDQVPEHSPATAPTGGDQILPGAPADEVVDGGG